MNAESVQSKRKKQDKEKGSAAKVTVEAYSSVENDKE